MWEARPVRPFLRAAAAAALQTVQLGPIVPQVDARNPWAVFSAYLGSVAESWLCRRSSTDLALAALVVTLTTGEQRGHGRRPH